jgi:hypothetical protein
MMHNQDLGTFAPTFQGIDEAEEFSNAMRIAAPKLAISEPVPVVATTTISA